MAHANCPVNQEPKQDDLPTMQSPAQPDTSEALSPPHIFASCDDNDCYFDIRLTRKGALLFRGEPVHKLGFKLSLARPFPPAQRIRSAEVIIELSNCPTKPEIVAIEPESILVDFVDLEETTNSSIGVTGGSLPTAPASLSATLNFSRDNKTSFKGSKLFHGWIQEPTRARWKMYEEPRSKSGLSPSIDLLLLVKSSSDFTINAELTVNRSCGWRSCWREKKVKITSPSEKGFNVKTMTDDLKAKLKPENPTEEFLQRGEAKLEELEVMINDNFPNLNLAAIYGGGLGVLMLREIQGTFRHKQFVLPKSPKKLVIGYNSRKAPSVIRKFDLLPKDEHIEPRYASFAGLSASPDTGAVHLQRMDNAPAVTLIRKKVSSQEKIKLKAGVEIELEAGDEITFDESHAYTDDDLSEESDSDNEATPRPGTQPDPSSTTRKRWYPAAEVIFAGHPKDAPKGLINVTWLDEKIRAVSPEAKDRISATKGKLDADIAAKFTVWYLLASTREQLRTVELLNELVNRRLHSLDMNTYRPTRWLHEDDWIDKAIANKRKMLDRQGRPRSRSSGGNGAGTGTHTPSVNSSPRMYSSRRDTNDGLPRFVMSAAALGGGGLTMARPLPTGEEVLANHRTVGGAWRESRI